MGIHAARRVLLGKETNAGTAVTPTAIMRAPGTWLNDQRTVIRPPDALAYYAPRPRIYTPRLFAGIPLAGDATYEQIGYILNAGLEGTAGVADTGSGYIYTRDFPSTAANTRYAYTLQAGDDQQCWEMEYGSVASFKLSWKAPSGSAAGEDGAWHYEADWIGRQATKTTFAASPSLPTVETILSPTVEFLTGFDSWEALAGVRSIELVSGANVPIWTANGAQYFTRVDQNWETRTNNACLLTIVHDFDAQGEARFDDWAAGTARMLRVVSEGSALGSSGAYTYKSLIITFGGIMVANPTFTDEDGNDLIAITFQAALASNFGTPTPTYSLGQIIVVNELSALP